MPRYNQKEKEQPSDRIVNALQERIREGMYGPGNRLPTERVLSAEFAADRSTVRAALVRLAQAGLIVREPGRRPWVSHPSTPVSPRRERLRPVASSRIIAVVLPQHEADHASRVILKGISDVLRSREAPYRMLVFDTNLRGSSRTALEQEASAAIPEEQIAGAIVWPALTEPSAAAWRQVAERGHPVVFVDRYDETIPSDFVGVDNYAAAKEAVEYLLKLGHTRIAHVTNNEQVSSTLERAEGYRDALREAGPGIAPSLCVIPNDTADEAIEDFIRQCASGPDAPTAVFALNDFLAHQLITRLEAHGLSVPAHISVIGFDDEDRYSPRPALLTTVRQPFERIGQRAATLLLRRLAATEPAHTFYQQVMLPTSVIERRTCLPCEKPEAASHPVS